MSCLSCGEVRDHPGKAAFAAATASATCAAFACAYSPTMSPVFEGLTLRVTLSPGTHSPPMKFLWISLMASSLVTRDADGAVRSNQAPARQIAQKMACAEIPPPAFVRVFHPVGEPTEFVGAHRYDVAGLMGEALAGSVPVRDRREHRAEEQGRAIGISVVRTEQLPGEVRRIAADFTHRRASFELKAILALDHEGNLHRPDVVETEGCIEEPQERADRTARVL